MPKTSPIHEHSDDTLTFLRDFFGEDEIRAALADKGKREGDILRAAISLFADKGFEATTTKEIARQAGVAEGTIFRYFKTKADILVSLIATSIIKGAAPRIFNPVEKILNQANKPTREILRELIKDRVSLIRNNITLLKVIITEIQYRPQLKKMWMNEFPKKGLLLMESFICQRIAAGEFRDDILPQQAAAMLAGMVGASTLLDFNLDDEIAWLDDEHIDGILDVYLTGMAWKRGEDLV